jgi:hypothetical protein
LFDDMCVCLILFYDANEKRRVSEKQVRKGVMLLLSILAILTSEIML